MLSVNALSGGIFRGGNAVMVEFIDVISVHSRHHTTRCQTFQELVNLVPRVFHLPTPKERGKKDPGSGWSRVLVTNYPHGRGPNL